MPREAGDLIIPNTVDSMILPTQSWDFNMTVSLVGPLLQSALPLSFWFNKSQAVSQQCGLRLLTLPCSQFLVHQGETR